MREKARGDFRLSKTAGHRGSSQGSPESLGREKGEAAQFRARGREKKETEEGEIRGSSMAVPSSTKFATRVGSFGPLRLLEVKKRRNLKKNSLKVL